MQSSFGQSFDQRRLRLLRRPPIIGDHGALLNYLLVSIVMVAGICLVNQRYKYKMVEESIVSRSE